MTPLPSNPGRLSAPTKADWLVIAVAVFLPTAVTWVYFIALNGAAPFVQQSAYMVGKSLQFLLPAVWVFGIQRESWSWSPPQTRYIALGALFGLLVATAMLTLYFGALRNLDVFAPAALAIRRKVESFGAGSPAAFLLLALFYSAIHSLLEEYYWRWFVFGQLSRGWSLSIAIVVSSVAFAAHHVLVLALYFGWSSPFTWLFSLAIVIGGAVWAWLYRASESLLAPWLSHALVDAAIFAIGYSIVAT